MLLIDLRHISSFIYPKCNLLAIVKELTMCFPERFDALFLVNSPAIVRMLWAPWSLTFPRSVLRRITVLNKNFRQNLLNKIPQSQLERRFGGRCSDLAHFFPPHSLYFH